MSIEDDLSVKDHEHDDAHEGSCDGIVGSEDQILAGTRQQDQQATASAMESVT